MNTTRKIRIQIPPRLHRESANGLATRLQIYSANGSTGQFANSPCERVGSQIHLENGSLERVMTRAGQSECADPRIGAQIHGANGSKRAGHVASGSSGSVRESNLRTGRRERVVPRAGKTGRCADPMCERVGDPCANPACERGGI